MYRFDERFLEQVGLAGMPEDQRESFLQYVQDQFEIRIGEQFSNSLSEAQLEEFEKIGENDEETINAWLGMFENYKEDSVFKKLLENSGEPETSPEIINNFVTAKWLEVNYPQYPQMLEGVLKDMQNDIISQRETILA